MRWEWRWNQTNVQKYIHDKQRGKLMIMSLIIIIQCEY